MPIRSARAYFARKAPILRIHFARKDPRRNY